MHGVPDLVVDVLVDGAVAIEAMEFADAPVITTLPAGDVEIVVAATGTTTPVLWLDATLTSGTSVTVAAHLDALGAPKLAAYENRTTLAGVQPFHLADFGAVDVLAGAEVVLAAVPGAPGTAVLVAHVDSRTEGLGPFAGLVALAVGDLVTLSDAAGRTTTWAVVARESVPKEELPTDRLGALHGPPVLALVTCGGAFDPEARRYAENVVVWAVPVDGSPGAARS